MSFASHLITCISAKISFAIDLTMHILKRSLAQLFHKAELTM